jgi:hypothetical protein
MLKNMMENMKPMDKMRIALKQGKLDEVKKAAQGMDMKAYAGEFASLSIYYNNPRLLEYFFKEGADVKRPPESITPSQVVDEDDGTSISRIYRQTPFMI